MSVSKYVFKIILVGDGRVGKTSLLLRFTENKFRAEYKKTLGTDFAVKNVKVNGEEVKLQIWDLGGQELFRDLRKAFYPGAKAALIVYESVPAWHADIVSALKKIPIIVVGNKIDLPRDVSYQDAKSLCDRLSVEYIETSAKLDQNVADAFLKIASNAVISAKGLSQKAAPPEPVVKIPAIVEKPILTTPKIFESPKHVSSGVNSFYEWFDRNNDYLNSIAEDLLTLDISKEKELIPNMEGELFKLIGAHGINSSLEANNTCLRLYSDSKNPVLSIILDLNLNSIDYFKKCLISLLLAAVALKKYNINSNVNFYIVFGDYSKEDEDYKEYFREVAKKSDYTIMIVEREFDSIGIIPKKTLSYTVSFQGDKSYSSPYILNNALLKYVAKLFKQVEEPLEKVNLSNSKINITSINGFNTETSSSSIGLDFSVNYAENTEKIKQMLNDVKQTLVEDGNLKIVIEENTDKLSPMITHEAPLLLVLRDIIYYNLERIVRITYEEPYGSIANLSSLPKPFVLLGFTKIPLTNIKTQVFNDIIIPAKIISGTLIDLTGSG
ncbi:MAG: Rab family GTPase [Candidatus Odinarchaeota archaeon]